MEEGDPACASRATSTATRAADAEARSRVLMKEEDPAIDADAAAEVEALTPPAGMTQRKRMLLGQVEQQPEVGHEISSEDDERGIGVAACTRKGVAERQRRAVRPRVLHAGGGEPSARSGPGGGDLALRGRRGPLRRRAPS